MLTALIEGSFIHGIDIVNTSQTNAPRFQIEASESDGRINIGDNSIKTHPNATYARPNAVPMDYWSRFGTTLATYDYVRDRIIELYTQPFASYSTLEQDILLEFVIPTIADLETVYTPEQVKQADYEYVKTVKEGRERRFILAATVLRANLGKLQTDGVVANLLPRNEVPNYWWFGTEFIKDYIYSTNDHQTGGAYLGKGLLDQGFVPLPTATLTMTELADECNAILFEGTDRNGAPIPPNGS